VLIIMVARYGYTSTTVVVAPSVYTLFTFLTSKQNGIPNSETKSKNIKNDTEREDISILTGMGVSVISCFPCLTRSLRDGNIGQIISINVAPET
jgi:hypothetical protein